MDGISNSEHVFHYQVACLRVFYDTFATQLIKSAINCRLYRTTPRLKESSSSKSNGTSSTVITKKGKVIYKIQQAHHPRNSKAAENARSSQSTGKTGNVRISKPKPSDESQSLTPQAQHKSPSNSLQCKETPRKSAETPLSKCNQKVIDDVHKTVSDKPSLPQFTDTSVPKSRMDYMGNPKLGKYRIVDVHKVVRESPNMLNSICVKGPRQSKVKAIPGGDKSSPDFISNDSCFSVKPGRLPSKAFGAFVELRPKRIRFSSKEMVYPDTDKLEVSKPTKRIVTKNTQTMPDTSATKLGKAATNARAEPVKPGERSCDSGCVGSSKNSVGTPGGLKSKKEVEIQSVQYNENLTIHKHTVNRTKKAASGDYGAVGVFEKDGKTTRKVKYKKGPRGLSQNSRKTVFTEGSVNQDGLLRSKSEVVLGSSSSCSGKSKQFDTCESRDNKHEPLKMDLKSSNYKRKNMDEVSPEGRGIKIKANDKIPPAKTLTPSFEQFVSNIRFEPDLFSKQVSSSDAQQAQSLHPSTNHKLIETNSTKKVPSGDENITSELKVLNNLVQSDAKTDGAIRDSVPATSNLNSFSTERDHVTPDSRPLNLLTTPSTKETPTTVMARKPTTDTSLNQTPQASSVLIKTSTKVSNGTKWSEEYEASLRPWTSRSNPGIGKSENGQGWALKKDIPCATEEGRDHIIFTENVPSALDGLSPANNGRLLVEKNKHLNTLQAGKENTVEMTSRKKTEAVSIASGDQRVDTTSKHPSSSFQNQEETFSSPSKSLRSETREVTRFVGNGGSGFDFMQYKAIFQPSNFTSASTGASAEFNCIPSGKPVFPPPCKSCSPRDASAPAEYNSTPSVKPPFLPVLPCSSSIDCIPKCKPVFPPPCKPFSPRNPATSVEPTKPIFPPNIPCSSNICGIPKCKPVFPQPCKSYNVHDPGSAKVEHNRFEKLVCSQKPCGQSHYEAGNYGPQPPCCPPPCCHPSPPRDPACAPSAKSKTYSILDVSDLPKPPIPIAINCKPKQKPCFPPKCASERDAAPAEIRQPSIQDAIPVEISQASTKPMTQATCPCDKTSETKNESVVYNMNSSISWLCATKIFFNEKVYSIKCLLTDIISNILDILKPFVVFSPRQCKPPPDCSSTINQASIHASIQASLVTDNQPIVPIAPELSREVKQPTKKESPRLNATPKKIIRIKRVRRTMHDDLSRRAIFLEEEKRKATGSKASPGLAYSEVLNIVFNQRSDPPITKKQRRMTN